MEGGERKERGGGGGEEEEEKEEGEGSRLEEGEVWKE